MKLYQVFLGLTLPSHCFYLFINFIDIVFNYFRIDVSDTTADNYGVTHFFGTLISLLYGALFYWAIICFMLFLYLERYNKFHTTYVYLRFVIIGLRIIAFITGLVLYFAYWDKHGAFENFVKVCLFFALDCMNIRWTSTLKTIIGTHAGIPIHIDLKSELEKNLSFSKQDSSKL